MQTSSSRDPKAKADEPLNPNQALEALHSNQEVVKKQLVDLQRTEAAHLQTISEVCSAEMPCI